MAEMIKVNDDTYRFEDEGVRFFLFCGTERAALIDTGMNTPDAKRMAEDKKNGFLFYVLFIMVFFQYWQW